MHASDSTPSYWMNVRPLIGRPEAPKDGGIAIIGSGLSGTSVAYWLMHYGVKEITLIDFEPEKSATFRNCGHILYGTVESMKALCSIHGAKQARDIWDYSIQICHEVRETIFRLAIEADYRQDGYLVMAIDETENKEIQDSISLLKSMDFESEYVEAQKLRQQGFKNVFGGRFEKGSAQAHPVKFRNALVENILKNGGHYFSGVQVKSIEGNGEHVEVTSQHGTHRFDAVVIATNAYSPLLSRFFEVRQLVDPFRGQIITSKPLQHQFSVRHPHSFDHGYEYALVTEDNRLMIGGWRNHTNGEMGIYDILPNPFVESGLKDFVREHYDISEAIEWEFSWAGIMAASKTGFPFIGPTSHPQIFTCAGFTGHGFSWAHGSAKLLADIMMGNPLPSVSRYFNPSKL